jgi:hypothetical protein
VPSVAPHPAHRRPALWAATAALTAAGVTVAVAATGSVGSGLVPGARAGAVGAPVPVVTSPNVSLVAALPETAAISLEFARTGPYAYVSSLDTISVLDISDPTAPKVTGTLVNAMFENEAMTYGERKTRKGIERFVIAGIDLYQVSPDEAENVNVGGNEIAIVDVTDPTKPFIRSRAATSTSSHTVQCVSQLDCTTAYTAGTDGTFSILDLRDLDAPREAGVAESPAAGPNSVFTSGAGHYWDFDGVYGWHTGSGGAAAFDVSNPLRPVVVATTSDESRTTPLNDFIHHNSMRPNGKAFVPGAEPALKNGNVLLVTEEDYANDGDEVVCERSGSFQTWHVQDVADKAITPLDSTNAPAEFGGGLSTPVGAFCSAHWFDYHQDGFVAQGWYQQGLRILDVRDPRNIAQHGYATSAASEVWDAYWVPERTKKGVARDRKTNILYTVDAVQGVQVWQVDLPARK